MTNHPPSVLGHCWLGHQTCKNRQPYNLYCVGADVKPCSINQSSYEGVVVCTGRCGFLTALKVSKLVLTTVGYAQVHVVAEACQSESSGSTSQITVTQVMHNQAVILQKALQCVPNPNTDFIMRNTASRLGQVLTKQVSVPQNSLVT